MTDYFIGIPIGISIYTVGVLKQIDWMADRETNYIFDDRNLLPKNRTW